MSSFYPAIDGFLEAIGSPVRADQAFRIAVEPFTISVEYYERNVDGAFFVHEDTQEIAKGIFVARYDDDE